MDEEKSESSCQETVSSNELDETDSSRDLDTLSIEVSGFRMQKNIGINNETVPILEEFHLETVTETDISAVVKRDDIKEGCDSLTGMIDINQPVIKASTSCTDLTDTEFGKSHMSSSDTNLSPDNQRSSFCSNTSASLPVLPGFSSYGSLNTESNHPAECTSVNLSKDVKETCSDEEETLFNNKLHVTVHQLCLKENSNVEESNFEIQGDIKTESFKSDELVQDKSQTGFIKDGKEPDACVSNNEEGKAHLSSARNTRSQTNLTFQPTLVDDSKLVKIALPTNPIHIMQSNTQFLNKSRNFLNFITEKSTNIMEKALPQHLTVKYNSMIKSIDSTYGDKKYTAESCTDTESPLTNLKLGSESSLAGKMINIPSSNSLEVIKKGKSDCQIDRSVGNDNPAIVKLGQNYSDLSMTNDSKNETVLSDDGKPNCLSETYTFQETNLTSTLDCNNSIINKTNEAVNFSDINEHVNEQSISVVSNSKSDNFLTKNTLEDNSVHEGEDESMNLDSVKLSLLQHPAYITLLQDYANVKTNSLKLQERVEFLEERKRTLEAEKSGEIFALQIETLEKTVDRLTSELRTALATQEVLKKEYNAANKERESMVMKYAVSEKQLIDTQRARECAERKAKETGKEQELLQIKLRQAQGERGRICNILDGKCREVADLQKEVEKLKEDVSMRDVKLKWTQNKLKTEMDLQKETQQKLEKATAKINAMKEECDQVRKETQESMRKFQQSEENKAVTLDQQLKEQQARLILERHVTEDKEMLRLQLQKEVEVLKNRQQVLIEENNTLSLKIQESEKNRLNYESNLSNLRILADERQKEIADLFSKVSELETLKMQLQHKDQRLTSSEAEMEHLRSANEELRADMFACRQREAEMLDFTQKLTDKNVRLQSEFTVIEAKAKQLEEEHGPLHERIRELSRKIKTLEESLTLEQKTRSEECEILARHLAEQTQLVQNLAQKLEDSQGENAVLKRKQQISMKEMTRELQQCRKRLETFEAASPCNSLDVTSRTGSNVSLNTGDTLNGALSDNSTNGDQPIQSMEPTRQALIDRIIKLQKINVRRAEKLDFLEEHTRTLVEELQKKTRIIQNYILHESFGAMGSNERDRHKHIKSRRNAAELARHGGIMASVYNQRVSDDTMTLELSLEINQKLQAVLEDALLKNITLKDNLDTLGEEIARLTMQNQQRQIAN